MPTNNSIAEEDVESARRINDRLQQHYYRVQSRQMCHSVWHDHLTIDQRARAGGDLNAFLGRGGTVALWMAVHNVSRNRAIVEVAELFGLPHGQAVSLLRSIGETVTEPVPACPKWDHASRQLSFRGRIARTIKRPKLATRVIAILDAFEEEGWPRRIDDPLPADVGRARLPNAIKSINQGLEGMRFHADGDDGVRWEADALLTEI